MMLQVRLPAGNTEWINADHIFSITPSKFDAARCLVRMYRIDGAVEVDETAVKLATRINHSRWQLAPVDRDKDTNKR